MHTNADRGCGPVRVSSSSEPSVSTAHRMTRAAMRMDQLPIWCVARPHIAWIRVPPAPQWNLWTRPAHHTVRNLHGTRSALRIVPLLKAVTHAASVRREAKYKNHEHCSDIARNEAGCGLVSQRRLPRRIDLSWSMIVVRSMKFPELCAGFSVCGHTSHRQNSTESGTAITLECQK
eukprot:1740463-Rhodomonas_salina.2